MISSEKGCRSANEFFKDIALAILSKDKKMDSDKTDLDRDYLSVNMRFNVDEVTYDKISESAKKHGWTLSKEICFRLNQTLSREPVMLENEIRELRKTRNEIVRIGQNIYYLIAQRQLLPVNDKNMWEDIKKLNALIEDVKVKVNYLADARANILPVKRGVMMGVKVKKEDRIRRVAEQRSEKIRRFPEAHKVRHGGKNYSRGVRDRAFNNGNSREVLVRITGSGRTPRGVKNEINYIAREGELTLCDSEGKEYCIKEREERKQSYTFMTDREDKLVYKDESAPKLVHNMVFSAPTIAGVSEADAFKSVETTLKEKYPDNHFVMAYHKDTDSHHVHVLLRIPDNYGKRINIRKQDLRELREKFAGQLQKMGYNVTCTHKYQFGFKSELKREHDRQRGLYEVVKFGRASYRFNPKNGDQNYITLRILKNKTEVTYWGVNLAEEVEREQIKPGSVISFKKEGATAVKVPKLDRQGKQVGWTETHRNNWRIENQGQMGIKTKPFPKEIKLDSPEQLMKHKRSMAVFKQSKAAMLALKEQLKKGIKIGGIKF